MTGTGEKEINERHETSGRITPARGFLQSAGALVEAPAVRAVREGACARGIEAWLVGGTLRDIACGRARAKDFDFALSGDPAPVAACTAEALGGTAFVLDREAPAWRVVAGVGNSATVVDLSPLNGPDIGTDLASRDFTVNAMGVGLDSLSSPGGPVILDPTGGYADCTRRVLRATGPDVFDDDPLRVMRAVRFAVELGFDIDPATRAAAGACSQLLERVSMERVHDELVMIFSATNTAGAISDIFDLGIADAVLPEFAEWEEVDGYPLLAHTLKVVDEAESLGSRIKRRDGALIEAIRALRADAEAAVVEPLSAFMSETSSGLTRAAALKLAAFLHDAGKAVTLTREDARLRFTGHDREGARIVGEVLKRLRFSKRSTVMVCGAVRDHHRVFNLRRLERRSTRAIANLFRRSAENAGGDTGAGMMLLLLALADARATIGGEDRELAEFIASMTVYYFTEFRVHVPEPVFTGREVMELFGVPEGPVVGEIMRVVSDALDSGEVEGRAGAIEFVRAWLANRSSG